MNYKTFFAEENEMIRERYELAVERIKEIVDGEDYLTKGLRRFFYATAKIAAKVDEVHELLDSGRYYDMSLEELAFINRELYEDIIGENYSSSYGNPQYIYETLHEEFDEDTAKRYTRILSFLNAEIRACIPYAFEFRLEDITVIFELFLEVYMLFGDKDIDVYKAVKSAVYYYVSDYSDKNTEYRMRETLDPEYSFATDIIIKSDLSDYRYLYMYGEYVSETEILVAKHLNSLSDNQIKAMASTFTQGYRQGFIGSNIDMSKKSNVNIRYQLGFERIVREEIKQFEAMKLKPVIYRYAVTALKRRAFKVGYASSSPNKQYDYDHRFDKAVFFDKALMEKLLVNEQMSYEKYAELADDYAGPAAMEVFGEKPFRPVACQYANSLSEKQEKLTTEYTMKGTVISNEYIKRNEISFSIIAYPVPDIGDKFKDVFNETVKVNTLNLEAYKCVHEAIINALNMGEYVRIYGMNGNKTDLKVMLYRLDNPEKETIFENCLADVNIPLGEVFTSPVLKGTEGILHVKEVYLNELKYDNFELRFEDGMVKEYTCSNYDSENENLKYIKENVLFNHETLPMGEFAIGTNTTAYVMGRKNNIADKLPILIAEKTGPHFAIGDTCYSMSEDTKVYNPDGKEIVAKDNEISVLRKTDMMKAYFNCHTDITIPYDELGEIAVYTSDGTKITIIEEGRFVLEGTQMLNDVLAELD